MRQLRGSTEIKIKNCLKQFQVYFLTFSLTTLLHTIEYPTKKFNPISVRNTGMCPQLIWYFSGFQPSFCRTYKLLEIFTGLRENIIHSSVSQPVACRALVIAQWLCYVQKIRYFEKWLNTSVHIKVGK